VLDTSPYRLNYNLGMQSNYDEQIVAETLQEWSQMQAWRNTFASQWEEVAELIDPNSRNTFFAYNFNWPGQKKTDRQVDATGMMAHGRFKAICDSLLTPRNSIWHGLASEDPYVMKDRDTRLWFEQVTKLLFQHRYAARANFSANNQAYFGDLGAYGTAGMFIDASDGSDGTGRGLRYQAARLGELFIRQNHQGKVDGVIRWFRLTAQQAMQKWGPARFPEVLRPALDQKSPMIYDFLHRVVPRTDYDPGRMDAKGKAFASYYVCVIGKTLMGEGGFHSFPYAVSRYEQAPGEFYGRGPAMMVLPALKTLNAEKRTFLKQGHRAADPVLLTAEDGLVDISMRPGALNKGGVSPDGKALIMPLPTGTIQISKEMMDEERSLINDAFLVSLFQILTETPTMTATEVIERTNEKGILIAPTMGRQHSEYIGNMVPREIDLLAQQGLLPPMPPRLREARGHYGVTDTSPISRAAQAGAAAGFIRTVETTKELVAITQDQSLLDVYDFDTAQRDIAAIQGVNESWMSSPQQIAQKRKARAAQQQQQAAIQAAPAQAAMMKAQAAQQKAGMGPNTGQPQGGQAPAQGGPPLAQQLGG